MQTVRNSLVEALDVSVKHSPSTWKHQKNIVTLTIFFLPYTEYVRNKSWFSFSDGPQQSPGGSESNNISVHCFLLLYTLLLYVALHPVGVYFMDDILLFGHRYSWDINAQHGEHMLIRLNKAMTSSIMQRNWFLRILRNRICGGVAAASSCMFIGLIYIIFKISSTWSCMFAWIAKSWSWFKKEIHFMTDLTWANIVGLFRHSSIPLCCKMYNIF